jgi:hypothetical protein
MRAERMKMMNMKVIMMASLQMMQVNVPTMLMSIRISAMVDGVIRLFMSFCCRFVYKDCETDLTYPNKHQKIFSRKRWKFTKTLETVGLSHTYLVSMAKQFRI